MCGAGGIDGGGGATRTGTMASIRAGCTNAETIVTLSRDESSVRGAARSWWRRLLSWAVALLGPGSIGSDSAGGASLGSACPGGGWNRLGIVAMRSICTLAAATFSLRRQSGG